MATELPAQSGGALDDGVADGEFADFAGDADDLDAELGDDIALDDEEAAP